MDMLPGIEKVDVVKELGTQKIIRAAIWATSFPDSFQLTHATGQLNFAFIEDIITVNKDGEVTKMFTMLQNFCT